MALKNKVIVILGNTRYDGSIQSTSLFIARNLAADNKVFFVEYPFTWKDYFRNRDSKEVTSRKANFAFRDNGIVNTDLPNLKIVVLPPVVPVNFLPEAVFRPMLQINEAIISARIKKALRAEGIREFIYINAFNFHFPGIAERIKPALTVYQCVDPMIVPYDMKHGIKSENSLVKKSDLVICTSKALYEEKKQQNPNTYLVPNAADTEHCSKALDEQLPKHPKLKNFSAPIIGYVGSIERRIDYAMLTQVTQANPDKSFVFAGPCWKEYVPEALLNMPNFHLIGPVPYDEMPQIVKGFDVTVIPFRKDEVSKTIFPLKLFEYLCAGKPVVATDFNPDLEEYTKGTVAFCADAASFSKAISEALTTDNPSERGKRMAVAAENSWEKRAGQVGDIIREHLSA